MLRVLTLTALIAGGTSGCAVDPFAEDLPSSGSAASANDDGMPAGTDAGAASESGDPAPSDGGGSTGGGPAADGSTGSDVPPAADGSTGDAPATDDGATVDQGLPCEIRDILTDYCGECHGAVPQNDAEQTLLQRGDLLADSPSSPGKTIAEVAVERFSSTDARMPPLPHWSLLDARAQLWAAWVDDGMPAGSCPPGGGTDPYADVNPGCVSGQFWNGGNDGDSKMDPGEACIDCHSSQGEGPNYRFAGTIYSLGHEPNDCFGISGGATGIKMMVKDAEGDEATISVNSAGNFMARSSNLPTGFNGPWSVKVVDGDRELFMEDPITDGDCNLCHTQAGTEDAPGRIVVPY